MSPYMYLCSFLSSTLADNWHFLVCTHIVIWAKTPRNATTWSSGLTSPNICLTHWGRVTHITHICVGNLTIIGSDSGLSPGRRQATIWTNDAILWIRPLGTNFSEILIEFLTLWFRKIRLNVSSGKWWPFGLSINVLRFMGLVRGHSAGLIKYPQ